jgi:hypothetical protein
MSRPQAKNGSQKKRSKKAALSPLIRAIREALSSKSKPKLHPEREEKRKDPAPDRAPFTTSAVRFKALKPRVLLSAHVNPAALTIAGAISVQSEQDNYEFTVQESRRVVFDSLTDRSDMTWTLEAPAGRVAHAVHSRDAKFVASF